MASEAGRASIVPRGHPGGLCREHGAGCTGVPEEVAARQLERLARVRAERDDEACSRRPSTAVEDEARGNANLMPAIVEAVEAYGVDRRDLRPPGRGLRPSRPLAGGVTVEPPLLRGRRSTTSGVAGGRRGATRWSGWWRGEPMRREMPSGVADRRAAGRRRSWCCPGAPGQRRSPAFLAAPRSTACTTSPWRVDGAARAPCVTRLEAAGGARDRRRIDAAAPTAARACSCTRPRWGACWWSSSRGPSRVSAAAPARGRAGWSTSPGTSPGPTPPMVLADLGADGGQGRAARGGETLPPPGAGVRSRAASRPAS